MKTRREIEPRAELKAQSLRLIGIPKSYISKELDDYEGYDANTRAIKDVVNNYLENVHDMYDDNTCLLFYGNNGTGKSFLMSIMAKYCYSRYYKTFFGSISEIINFTFKNSLDESEQRRKESFNSAEFLFIDEIGKENDTRSGSTKALLELTLKQAFERGKVVCLATNLDIEDIEERYGKTLGSILDEYVKVQFKGKDYRGKVLREKDSIRRLSK